MDRLPASVRWLLCADWAGDLRGRAACLADLRRRRVAPLAGPWSLHALLAAARRLAATGPVLVGMDLPFGLPAPYFAAARREREWAGARGFVDWLPRACGLEGYFACTDGSAWSVRQPFFAVPPGRGGLGGVRARIRAAGAADLRRMDVETGAKPLFVRSGIPGSVGSSVCDVWPRLGTLLADPARDFALWPMEGSLPEAFARRAIVVGELYPGAAYATALGEGPGERWPRLLVSKGSAAVREAALRALLARRWIREAGVGIRGAAEAGASQDAFDALLSAAAMLRCALDGAPVADLGLGDPAVEGAILGTGTVDLEAPAQRFAAR